MRSLTVMKGVNLQFLWFKRLMVKMEKLIVQSGIFVFAIGLLLGRAVILNEMSPFAIPFFASILLLKREYAKVTFFGVILGASFYSLENSLFVATGAMILLLLNKMIERRSKDLLKTLPILVLISGFSSRVLFMAFEQSMVTTEFIVAAVESSLSLLLAMIFLQSIPLLTLKPLKRTLRNEEIVCFIILLASILTGTIGWTVYDMSLENLFARYIVMLLAFIGGAAIGATVGVVIGLILSLADVASLSQMSLLAFSGLLGGLLKEGKKFGVGIGLIVGTLLIGMYGGKTLTSVYPALLESLVAFLLFLITPQSAIKKIARYIPGTNEHSKEQQQYLKKLRDVTANRVEQFSSLFQTLSNSFTQAPSLNEDGKDNSEIDYYLSRVTEKSCQTCFKKEACWVNHFDKTYDFMKQMMHNYEKTSTNFTFQREWDKHCVKSKKVKELIQYELSFYEANVKLRQKVAESQRLVADQLLGVSQVMGNFAKEIQREREHHAFQEDQIVESLYGLGLEIDTIDIYSLESGQADIEMTLSSCSGHGEGEKIIAPLLSDILKETIIVKKEEHAHYPGGLCTLMFGSAKAYVVETGFANAAKGGAFVSGDSYSTIELSSGKYAIAISDGMGNGERAHFESSDTLQLLAKILQSGIDETVAIKSVNSVLSLRTKDDIFSTLDLSMIDLQNASAKFLKIASTPSFIKRGDQVIMIESSNLPIGILQEFDVEVVSEQLKAGDLLIMMSDGIYEGANAENKEMWMKRKIRELKTEDPQEVADLILEEVIRTRHGDIQDDMTVVVANIQHNLPKWKTIPFYSSNLKRKKAQ
ncbi:stage II sporulation protein E [Pueribacillus theae]|uniref:Stage II sporulation protein E n=1 Tax=Pueribacillus theae TaxID=2171751 RepID=A0A2U1K3P2_9BACI|nr:stage II sporulation protein E [Pueribacillus theae]PWA12136.1 stage II sporulation protein E [Pueribacillus theae]